MADARATKLSQETAEVLLNAIKEATEDGLDDERLKNLAEAYATVVGAMPKRDSSLRSVAAF